MVTPSDSNSPVLDMQVGSVSQTAKPDLLQPTNNLDPLIQKVAQPNMSLLGNVYKSKDSSHHASIIAKHSSKTLSINEDQVGNSNLHTVKYRMLDLDEADPALSTSTKVSSDLNSITSDVNSTASDVDKIASPVLNSLPEYDDDGNELTITQEDPVTLPVPVKDIQTKASELSKTTQTSTQKCLQDLIKDLGPNTNITSSLQKQDGKYLVEPFSLNNSFEICYKIKVTYTLTPKDGKKPVTFERDIYTTATDPEQAIFAASAYKDAMAKLAKDSTAQDIVMKQSVFKLSSGASGKPSLSYQTGSNTYTNLHVDLKDKNAKYFADITQSDKKIIKKDTDAESIPLSRKVIYKSKQEAIHHRGYIVNDEVLKEKIRNSQYLESDLKTLNSDIIDLKEKIESKKESIRNSILNQKILPSPENFDQAIKLKAAIKSAQHELSNFSGSEEDKKAKQKEIDDLENSSDLKTFNDYQTALQDLASLQTLNQKLINQQNHLKIIENVISPKSEADTLPDKFKEILKKFKETFKDITPKQIRSEVQTNENFIKNFVNKLGGNSEDQAIPGSKPLKLDENIQVPPTKLDKPSTSKLSKLTKAKKGVPKHKKVKAKGVEGAEIEMTPLLTDKEKETKIIPPDLGLGIEMELLSSGGSSTQVTDDLALLVNMV